MNRTPKKQSKTIPTPPPVTMFLGKIVWKKKISSQCVSINKASQMSNGNNSIKCSNNNEGKTNQFLVAYESISNNLRVIPVDDYQASNRTWSYEFDKYLPCSIRIHHPDHLDRLCLKKQVPMVYMKVPECCRPVKNTSLHYNEGSFYIVDEGHRLSFNIKIDYNNHCCSVDECCSKLQRVADYLIMSHCIKIKSSFHIVNEYSRMSFRIVIKRSFHCCKVLLNVAAWLEASQEPTASIHEEFWHSPENITVQRLAGVRKATENSGKLQRDSQIMLYLYV